MLIWSTTSFLYIFSVINHILYRFFQVLKNYKLIFATLFCARGNTRRNLLNVWLEKIYIFLYFLKLNIEPKKPLKSLNFQLYYWRGALFGTPSALRDPALRSAISNQRICLLFTVIINQKPDLQLDCVIYGRK
jgi:hypothetical protein